MNSNWNTKTTGMKFKLLIVALFFLQSAMMYAQEQSGLFQSEKTSNNESVSDETDDAEQVNSNESLSDEDKLQKLYEKRSHYQAVVDEIEPLDTRTTEQQNSYDEAVMLIARIDSKIYDLENGIVYEQLDDLHHLSSNNGISQDDWTLEDYQKIVDGQKAKIEQVKTNPEMYNKYVENGEFQLMEEQLEAAIFERDAYCTKYGIEIPTE